MRIFQRGVLPPVNFAELDALLQGSLLSPAGARLVGNGDLTATLLADTLGPSGTRSVAFADMVAALQASQLGPAGARTIVPADLDTTLYSLGNFAPTWTGFSVAPVGNLSWIRFNTLICLYNSTGGFIQGTSNATTMSITNLPATIIPTVTRGGTMLVIDNANILLAYVDITSGGAAVFNMLDTGIVAGRITRNLIGFTAAGQKGLHGLALIVYPF